MGLVGADGIVPLNDTTIAVVTNNPPAVYRIESTDQFATGTITGKFEPGQVNPTTVAERPNPSAKFEARGTAVEGDISKVVGGATDKPIPKAPKKIEPKGAPGAASGGMSSLMEAKRRARQQIEQKEKEE